MMTHVYLIVSVCDAHTHICIYTKKVCVKAFFRCMPHAADINIHTELGYKDMHGRYIFIHVISFSFGRSGHYIFETRPPKKGCPTEQRHIHSCTHPKWIQDLGLPECKVETGDN